MSDLYFTTQDKVNMYNAVTIVFNELFKELKELGKKKPEATLSKSKVKIINRILQDAIECLSDEPCRKYLDLLDDESLPQYSDAILILAQHDGALKSFKDRHWGRHNGEYQWVIRGK